MGYTDLSMAEVFLLFLGFMVVASVLAIFVCGFFVILFGENDE